MPEKTPPRKADFSGFATKYGIVCTDGRTILPDAFKHYDGKEVPLLYHHNVSDIDSVVGHVVLEHRDGIGVYAHGYINPNATHGKQALALVQHGDIKCLSVSANQLRQNGTCVVHGDIREISLVVSGANRGARIENVLIERDGMSQYDDETADIFCGGDIESLAHTDPEPEPAATPHVEHADPESPNDKLTVAAIWDTFTHEQQEASYILLGSINETTDEGSVVAHAAEEGKTVGEIIETLNPQQRTALNVMIAHVVADQKMEHADTYDDVQSLFDKMTPQQRQVIYSMLNAADQAFNVERQFKDLPEEQQQAFYSMMTAAMSHGDTPGLEHAEDETVGDIWETLSEKQQVAVAAIIAELLDSKAEHSDITQTKGESNMQKNVFDNTQTTETKATLQHAEMQEILAQAKGNGLNSGYSLRETFGAYVANMEHAATYGIDNIEVLFPDAQLVRNEPDIISRDMGWVGPFLSATTKTPFARLRSTAVDLTEDEARAKGYITAELKKEQVIPAMKRETNPQTVYKKQKLDRDNVIDITSFDVVVFKKRELRTMLDEELARAALVGDGRSLTDPDKIREDCIRPVWTDVELYAKHIVLPAATTAAADVDAIVEASQFFYGSGMPNFYTNKTNMFRLFLARDGINNRQFKTMPELSASLLVRDVLALDVMDGLTRVDPISGDTLELIGIILNPVDYTFGADKGGQVSFFDDFDIDFNQMKFLIETRVSGALTKPRSAVVIERVVAP